MYLLQYDIYSYSSYMLDSYESSSVINIQELLVQGLGLVL